MARVLCVTGSHGLWKEYVGAASPALVRSSGRRPPGEVAFVGAQYTELFAICVWVFLCTNRRARRKWCWKKSCGKQGGRAFSLSVGASQVGQKSLPGFSVCPAFAGSSLA